VARRRRYFFSWYSVEPEGFLWYGSIGLWDATWLLAGICITGGGMEHE
jgi:hypothetical protein